MRANPENWPNRAICSPVPLLCASRHSAWRGHKKGRCASAHPARYSSIANRHALPGVSLNGELAVSEIAGYPSAGQSPSDDKDTSDTAGGKPPEDLHMSQSNHAVTTVTPEYLSTPEAARLLDISASALRQSRSTGRLMTLEAPQWVKFGKAVRYRRRDLVEWAERVAVECRAAQG